MESMPRHDDEDFHWSLDEWQDRVKDVRSSLSQRQLNVDTQELFPASPGETGGGNPDDDVRHAWGTARSAAVAYLNFRGRSDLAKIVEERCHLAISHTDKWITSFAPSRDQYVIRSDQGLMGVLQRLTRYLVMYFRWDPTFPGRVYGYAEPFPPDAMERLFRVYFRNARFGGIFCTRDLVLNPPSFLVRILPVLTQTFILLHEISHVLIAYDPALAQSESDEEIVCDTVAAEMFTHIQVPDPGLRALATRLFFAMQRALEDAVYMIPPSTHPSARIRATEALSRILETTGPTGEIAWSRMVFTPVDTLIDMAALSPAWVDVDTPLDAVYDWASPHFEIVGGSGHDQARRMIKFYEDIDCGIHQPPDSMAEFLVERINMCLGLDSYDMSACSDELLDLVRGQPPSASLGWSFIDLFIELNATEIQSFRDRVRRDGLRYCDYYWFKAGRDWGFLLDYFIWALVHIRLGWDNGWGTGVRAWGWNLKHERPREMTDMNWVIENGHRRDAP